MTQRGPAEEAGGWQSQNWPMHEGFSIPLKIANYCGNKFVYLPHFTPTKSWTMFWSSCFSSPNSYDARIIIQRQEWYGDSQRNLPCRQFEKSSLSIFRGKNPKFLEETHALTIGRVLNNSFHISVIIEATATILQVKGKTSHKLV
jgi:hypothetical protein